MNSFLKILRNKAFLRVAFFTNAIKTINKSRVLLPCVMLAEQTKPSHFEIDFSTDIKKAYRCSEDKIIELIQTIETKLVVASERYRNLIERQISVLVENQNVNPLSETWDDAVKFRVEAANVKKELERIQTLIESMEQLAYSLVMMSTSLDFVQEGIETNVIDSAIASLKETMSNENVLNREVERKLWRLTECDILQTNC